MEESLSETRNIDQQREVDSIPLCLTTSQTASDEDIVFAVQGAKSEVDEVEHHFQQETVDLNSDSNAFANGQSTPMEASFENTSLEEGFLDVSRVEIAEELQKEQNDRLEKLWKQQNEQNQKIFDKLDESMTRQNRNTRLREQHARQMEHIRQYYEEEMNSLKKQLADMKNVIFEHKQQETSMRSEIQQEFADLSQKNMELSSKCDGLESARQLLRGQLKQTNIEKMELENQCQQLLATSQVTDARFKELKQNKADIASKVKEFDVEKEKLQTQCDTAIKEKAILKRSKDELERNFENVCEENRELMDKYHKLKDESEMDRSRSKLQESLVKNANKSIRERELVIETLKTEIEDNKVKYEVDKSLFSATQQRVERLVVQNRDKDLMIKDLEEKVKNLEQTVKDVSSSAAKAGLNEIRESVRRDKELLKRILREYDSLNDRYDKTKDQVNDLEGKLAESKGEGQTLRKELTEANINRKNLEISLREVLNHQNSDSQKIVERSSRKMWEQPTTAALLFDQRLKQGTECLKVKEPKESTRKFNNIAEKDDAIEDALGASNDDSMICAYCNQLFKKGKKISKTIEEDAVDRRAFIISTEKRFLELSEQRRRLESALRKISWSKTSAQAREDKKFLENRLDEVLKELGKTRLQLKGSE